jgi:hypothetical protein
MTTYDNALQVLQQRLGPESILKQGMFRSSPASSKRTDSTQILRSSSWSFTDTTVSRTMRFSLTRLIISVFLENPVCGGAV